MCKKSLHLGDINRLVQNITEIGNRYIWELYPNVTDINVTYILFTKIRGQTYGQIIVKGTMAFLHKDIMPWSQSSVGYEKKFHLNSQYNLFVTGSSSKNLHSVVEYHKVAPAWLLAFLYRFVLKSSKNFPKEDEES